MMMMISMIMLCAAHESTEICRRPRFPLYKTRWLHAAFKEPDLAEGQDGADEKEAELIETMMTAHLVMALTHTAVFNASCHYEG